MRIETITKEIYTFEELSDEAKKKALNSLRDINVDHDWWQYLYDDAKNVGIEIISFNLDRNRHCKIKFTKAAESVIDSIMKEHGNMCETYKVAASFEKLFDVLDEDWGGHDEKREALVEDLQHDLEETYIIILQNEYEYLTSDEAIKEMIEANEYEFTIDSKLY